MAGSVIKPVTSRMMTEPQRFMTRFPNSPVMMPFFLRRLYTRPKGYD
jgi:hypothetical protein